MILRYHNIYISQKNTRIASARCIYHESLLCFAVIFYAYYAIIFPNKKVMAVSKHYYHNFNLSNFCASKAAILKYYINYPSGLNWSY